MRQGSRIHSGRSCAAAGGGGWVVLAITAFACTCRESSSSSIKGAEGFDMRGSDKEHDSSGYTMEGVLAAQRCVSHHTGQTSGPSTTEAIIHRTRDPFEFEAPRALYRMNRQTWIK